MWLKLFGNLIRARDVSDESGRIPIMTYEPFKLLYQGTWAKNATKTITNADKYKLFALYFYGEGIVLLGVKEPQTITNYLNFSSCKDETNSYVYKATFKNTDTNSWTLTGASRHTLNTNGNAGVELYTTTMYIYGVF